MRVPTSVTSSTPAHSARLPALAVLLALVGFPGPGEAEQPDQDARPRPRPTDVEQPGSNTADAVRPEQGPGQRVPAGVRAEPPPRQGRVVFGPDVSPRGKPILCAYCVEAPADTLVGARLESRSRVEGWRDPGDNQRAPRGLLRNRLMFEGEWKGLGANLELIDGREFFTDTELRSQANPVDVLQANAYWRKILNTPLTLRVGRQAINVGSRRLVAAPTWKNLVRAFESVRLTAKTSDKWAVDFFGGRRVIIDPEALDDWENGEYLWGGFLRTRLLPGLSVEAYLFGLHQGDTSAKGKPVVGEDGVAGATNRFTPGFRIQHQHPVGISAELEGMAQFGNRANDRILAFAAELDVGYTFPVWGKPQLHLLYSVASGDSDPEDGTTETFIPLFAAVHKYHGHLDLFRGQNFHELASVQQIKLFNKVHLRTAVHAFWLYTRQDNWYNSSGKVVRAAADGLPTGMVGVELDGMVRWAIFPFWELEVGGGVFFSRWEPAPRRNAFIWLQTLFRIGSYGKG